MLRTLPAALAAAVVLSPVAASAASWDAFSSFNGTGVAGQFIFFGYTGPAGSTPPTLMTASPCPADITCIRAGDPTLAKPGAATPATLVVDDGSVLTIAKDRLVVDPAAFGAQVLFRAPKAGVYSITAFFTGAETLNNGMGLFYTQPATPAQALIPVNTVPHDLSVTRTVTLAKNQAAGFFFGPGRVANHDITAFNFTVSGSVPEPASWALMLMGFGGLGAALRRRRAAVA